MGCLQKKCIKRDQFTRKDLHFPDGKVATQRKPMLESNHLASASHVVPEKTELSSTY